MARTSSCDVLQRVGRRVRTTGHFREGTFAMVRLSTTGQAVGVATYEVAQATEVEGARPSMGVERDGFAAGRGCRNAHELVFE